MVFFRCFRLEIPFFGKFVLKNQNYQFKVKFGAKANSNMKNSMVMLTFFLFSIENTFFGLILAQNLKLCRSWNLVQRHFIMQNSMVVFTFSGTKTNSNEYAWFDGDLHFFVGLFACLFIWVFFPNYNSTRISNSINKIKFTIILQYWSFTGRR